MNNDFFPKYSDDRKEPEVTAEELQAPVRPAPPKLPAEPAEPEEADCGPKFSPGTVRAMDIVSTALSWVLVPLNMPLFGLWFLFGLSILALLPSSVKWQLTGLFFCLDIILPMLLVLLMKRLKLIEDIGLNGRKERAIPYLISIAVLAGSGYWCQRLGLPLWIAGFYYGGAVAGTVNLIVNFWWKISAHSAAMAGVLALLARLYAEGGNYGPTETWLVIWMVLTGLLGASRIWLGRHTPMQVFCGGLVGYFSVWFMTML